MTTTKDCLGIEDVTTGEAMQTPMVEDGPRRCLGCNRDPQITAYTKSQEGQTGNGSSMRVPEELTM